MEVRRHLFNLAAVVSLLLFVFTAAVWIRSYSYAESLSYDSQPRRGNRYWVYLGTGLGRVFVRCGYYETKIPTPIDLQPPSVVGFRASSRPFLPSAFKPAVDFAWTYDHELVGLGWGRKVTVVVVPQINRTLAN